MVGETEQRFYAQSIDVHAEPRDCSDTSGGDHGAVAKVLAGGHVAQMDLYDWCADGLIKGIELTDETEIKGRVDLGTADSYHVYGVVDEKGTRIELEKE